MPKTVLIADESITIRSVAESLLRGEGFSVRSAADGPMAMELAGSERPDLILVGEKLPSLSGAEVCTQLKGDPALASVPIIYMRTDRPGTSPGNVDAVLTKPFSPQTLLDAVHRFLSSGNEFAEAAHEVVEVEDDGLEEELIDKALGLKDVEQPAVEQRAVEPAKPGDETIESGTEEVETGTVEEFTPPSRAAAPEADEEVPDTGEQESEELPVLDGLESSQKSFEPKLDSSELEDFEVQAGMEERLPTSADSGADEIDKALDAAFGDTSAPPPGPAPEQPKPPIQQPQSSLNEVSLGDTPETVPPAASAETPPAGPASQPAAASGSEEEHDYEWFIAEMGKDGNAPAPTQPKPDERPRIEPVQPQAHGPGGTPPPKSDSKTKSSEFDINVEEFEASKRGYDEFISEFRKEIAKLEGAVPADDSGKPAAKGEGAFPESSDSAPSNADVKALGDRLIDAVAQDIARELAAKIDPKTVYALIEGKLSEVGKPRG